MDSIFQAWQNHDVHDFWVWRNVQLPVPDLKTLRVVQSPPAPHCDVSLCESHFKHPPLRQQCPKNAIYDGLRLADAAAVDDSRTSPTYSAWSRLALRCTPCSSCAMAAPSAATCKDGGRGSRMRRSASCPRPTPSWSSPARNAGSSLTCVLFFPLRYRRKYIVLCSILYYGSFDISYD